MGPVLHIKFKMLSMVDGLLCKQKVSGSSPLCSTDTTENENRSVIVCIVPRERMTRYDPKYTDRGMYATGK